VALVMARAEPLSAGHHDVCAQLDFLSLTSGYRRVSLRGVPVTFVASQVPAALSMSGRSAGILISSRLVDDLTPGELRAVLEHERTHVVRHHALIAQLARLNRACLPGFFGAREFERATRLLVELIADDAAARVSGPRDVASALRVVADARGDEAMSLRAQRISSRPTHPRLWTRRSERRLPEWFAGSAD
jgi:Zn-dependent protease with chaperone function